MWLVPGRPRACSVMAPPNAHHAAESAAPAADHLAAADLQRPGPFSVPSMSAASNVAGRPVRSSGGPVIA